MNQLCSGHIVRWGKCNVDDHRWSEEALRACTEMNLSRERGVEVLKVAGRPVIAQTVRLAAWAYGALTTVRARPWRFSLAPEEDVRGNRRESSLAGRRNNAATSPPLGGVSKYLCGRSSDLQAAYWPGFPTVESVSAVVGVRSCLPLRGSSGVAPDSHLHLAPGAKNHKVKSTISWVFL
jgi:hypothetical protein